MENNKEITIRNKGTKMVEGWRRLIRITNDELEKFRLNISRCVNRDVAPLIKLKGQENASAIAGS